MALWLVCRLIRLLIFTHVATYRLAVRFILGFIVSLFTVLTTAYRTAAFITLPGDCRITLSDWLIGTNGQVKIHGNHWESFISTFT